MTAARKLCTFHLGGLLFGIAAEQVQEVLRPLPITPLPLAPPDVAGLINLRGQIVPALDLRRRLGMAADERRGAPANLVLRGPQGPVSLLVEEIGDVLQIEDQPPEPVPDTLDAGLREMVAGVCPLPGGLLLLLDSGPVLSAVKVDGG